MLGAIGQSPAPPLDHRCLDDIDEEHEQQALSSKLTRAPR